LRINSAKDDAAGLAISDRMTSQINGISQAIRNTNDGMSLAQTAEGGLQETTNVLQRMRELSVQSANDTNTSDDRQSIQAEMNQLTSELDRIAEKTTFNNQNILDGSFSGAKFHVGANSNDTITVNVKDARASTLGSMARIDSAKVTLNDVNGQNEGVSANAFTTDLVALKSKGDVAFNIRRTSAADDNLSLSGTGRAGSAIAKAAAINDSTEFHGVKATVTETVANLGKVTSQNYGATDNLTINDVTITGIQTQDDDGDGTLVDSINAVADQTGVIAQMNEQHELVLTAEDGRNVQVDAQNSTGLADVLATQVFRGGLSLQSDENIEFLTGAAGVAGPLADMTVLGLSATEQVIGKNSNHAVDSIDVTTRAGANQAIDILDQALKQVSESRGGLGAVQNRMESTVQNLEVASENLSASRSRILDADFAQETAAFSRNQIMQQAGISVLAQANQQPQIALALLS